MRSVSRTKMWLVLLMSGLLVHDASAVNMEMVTVGNPGNPADPRYGGTPPYMPASFGAVGYTYQMGKHEVTQAQYTEFLNAVARVDTYHLYSPFFMWDNGGPSNYRTCAIGRSGSGTQADPYVYSVAPEWADRPMTWVNWAHAARFANWLTNGQPTGAEGLSTTEDGSYYLNGMTDERGLDAVRRKPNARYVVPTEDEWYKAAYYDPAKPGGAGYWDYATKSDNTPGRDMTEATNPGNNANGWSSLLEAYPIDPPYYTTVVGQFYLSHSAYGTFDQAGNVAEWNDTSWYARGGGFQGVWSAAGRGYIGYRTVSDGDVGFRIALVPEPGSLLLLLVGGVMAAVRRKT